jgi:hypothetical protein
MPDRYFYSKGLSRISQKTLLQQIELGGGLDYFRNKEDQKVQLLRPVLEKFPHLFGERGDTRRRQATDCVKYWYNNFYRENRYKELLSGFDVPCSLASSKIPPTPSAKIPPTPPTSATITSSRR